MCAALLAIAMIGCRGSGLRRRIGAVAEWGVFRLVFSIAGAILTYLAAARNGPLYDAQLAAADAALGWAALGWAALGCDWTAWYGFVRSHPVLQGVIAFPAFHAVLASRVLPAGGPTLAPATPAEPTSSLTTAQPS